LGNSLTPPNFILDFVDILVGYFSNAKVNDSKIDLDASINYPVGPVRRNAEIRWQKRSERNVKAALVDFLLDPEVISPSLKAIASEVPFLNGRRWVDILRIDSRELIAYEIKSEADSLKRLGGQVEDYVSTFDKTYLVFSSAQRKGIEKLRLGKRVGLIVYNETLRKFEVVREPVRNLKIKKENLSQFIWADELRKYLKEPAGDTGALRKKLNQRHNIAEIKELGIAALLKRYSYRYKFFMTDRGQRTHLADLDILTAESQLGRAPD
jgi:hypothetical protein